MYEQRSLKLFELFVILVEFARLGGLLFERSLTLFEFTEDVIDSYEVLLCAVEFSLGLILTDTVLNDT